MKISIAIPFCRSLTYASRLNQVQVWLNRISQQAIRHGTFCSVKIQVLAARSPD